MVLNMTPTPAPAPPCPCPRGPQSRLAVILDGQPYDIEETEWVAARKVASRYGGGRRLRTERLPDGRRRVQLVDR